MKSLTLFLLNFNFFINYLKVFFLLKKGHRIIISNGMHCEVVDIMRLKMRGRFSILKRFLPRMILIQCKVENMETVNKQPTIILDAVQLSYKRLV